MCKLNIYHIVQSYPIAFILTIESTVLTLKTVTYVCVNTQIN